jgi:hypothetical protein
MANLLCMGLILNFLSILSPRSHDCSDHRLAASVHMDMVDRDLLVAFTAMAIEGF